MKLFPWLLAALWLALAPGLSRAQATAQLSQSLTAQEEEMYASIGIIAALGVLGTLAANLSILGHPKGHRGLGLAGISVGIAATASSVVILALGSYHLLRATPPTQPRWLTLFYMQMGLALFCGIGLTAAGWVNYQKAQRWRSTKTTHKGPQHSKQASPKAAQSPVGITPLPSTISITVR